MTTTTNREIHLKTRPVGLPRESDFELVEVAMPPVGDGEVLVRNIYMSVDPYMNKFGRIVMCGMISMYNATEPVPGPPNLFYMIGKQLTMKGFIISEHFDRLPQFYADMSKWIADGQIKWKETIVEGLENASAALIGLFKGDNFGKMIIKVGD